MDGLKEVIQKKDVFVIAEIGMNHDGSFGNAIRLIDEAKNSGVDAVKFQLHISEEESLKNAPKPPYFTIEERFEYFNRTAFSTEKWIKLKEHAHSLNLYFIVSPFSLKAVNILEEIGLDGYKIASGETTNLPLLEFIDTKNKPVLLSTGMSNWEEINNAIKVIKKNLLVLFQCSSEYPCTPENVGFNIIEDMVNDFKELFIGYSDHTLENATSIGALLMGAKVFEKHFTLSKKMYGADARFSLEPDKMREYVNNLNFISKSMKNPVDKNDISKYKEMKLIFEKSLIASKDLNKGHVLIFEDLYFKKPCDGIRADKYKEIIGKTLIKDIKKDEKIYFENLES